MSLSSEAHADFLRKIKYLDERGDKKGANQLRREVRDMQILSAKFGFSLVRDPTTASNGDRA